MEFLPRAAVLVPKGRLSHTLTQTTSTISVYDPGSIRCVPRHPLSMSRIAGRILGFSLGDPKKMVTKHPWTLSPELIFVD